MASVAADKLSPAEKEQLAVSYAAFVLGGQGAEVNAESLNAVLKAAAIDVSASLVAAFAKTLQGKDISSFYGSVGGGASAPAASTPAETAKAPAKEAAKPAAAAEPAEEEEDMDMGGLFD